MTRRSGPQAAPHRTPAKESDSSKGTPRRPRLALAPPLNPYYVERQPLSGPVPAPRRTTHEWLVSWCWPNDPGNVRHRMFHTREAAHDFRRRIEASTFDHADPFAEHPQVVTRIDVRDVLPWVEVG